MNSGLITRPAAEIESGATHFPVAAELPIHLLPDHPMLPFIASFNLFIAQPALVRTHTTDLCAEPNVR